MPGGCSHRLVLRQEHDHAVMYKLILRSTEKNFTTRQTVHDRWHGPRKEESTISREGQGKLRLHMLINSYTS